MKPLLAASTLLLSLHQTTPFLPSHSITSRTVNSGGGAFRFYAADDDDAKKRQRRIRIHVDQNVSMKKGGSEDGDGSGNEEVQNQQQEPPQSSGNDAGKDDSESETTDEVINTDIQATADFDGADSAETQQDSSTQLPPQRRRKRDFFKRAFGLTSSISPEEQDVDPNIVLPSDDEISSELKSIMEQIGDEEPEEEDVLFFEGDELPMPNFLTDEDEARLNATYTKMREEGLKQLMEDYEKGDYGNVTLEEATKIVKYAVNTEQSAAREKLNQLRSIESIRRMNKEAEDKENELVANITSDGMEQALERDALVREIVTNEEDEEEYERAVNEKIKELGAYTRDLMRNETEMMVNITRQILEENPDPDLDYYTVFDAVVAGIQRSRNEKLSKPTFGVMGSSIELEQARQIGRISKERDKEEQAARDEALNKGYCVEAELDEFFRVPTDAAGERMYRAICRSVLGKRPPPADDTVDTEGEKKEENLSSEENAEDEDNDWNFQMASRSQTFRNDPFFRDEEAEKLYRLTPAEKAEVFKLLKDWRVVENHRNQAVSEEKRPASPIKPLFLYTEDSERTREWEKREATRALQSQLKSDDEVENASNELLIKEITEGGYTKERSLRLVDKLIAKATDKIIKEALLDIKATLLETEEEPKEVVTGPKKPVFVDIKQVLTRDDEEDKKVAQLPPKQSISKPVKPVESKQNYIEQDLPAAPVAPPKSEFFSSGADISNDPNRTAATSEFLGSYEEQLFTQFAKKTGAETEEEKAELKRNLDALNALRESGYSDDEANLEIDADKFLDDDSDSQLEALLSKRPVAAKQSEHELVEIGGHLEEMKTGSEVDIASARYKALFAADDVDEADFRQYLKEEEEMRAKAENETLQELPEDADIERYAEEAVTNLNPRPVSTADEDLNENVGKLEAAYEKEVEDFDPFPVAKSSTPSWLERETEFMGVRRKDSTDGLTDEQLAEVAERQRLADAYLDSQEEVDIAEVLDRPYFGSMDEPDYKEKPSAILATYEGRKDELMEFTTLAIEDIINFVAWKQDSAITGVNKELRRLQNPFSEFGAIFRLEGVFVDLIGMQVKAWPRVAEKFGYERLTEDLIMKASLYTPAKAVRVVFGWSDDVVEVNEIVKAYHSEFNAAFNSWLEHDRAFVYRYDSTRRNFSGNKRTISSDGNTKLEPSRHEIYETYHNAWKKLAEKKNQAPPTADQVMKGIQIRDWEECIPKVFGWTEYTAEEVYDIVAEYDTMIKADMKALRQKYQPDTDEDSDISSKVAPMAEMPMPSKEEINTCYSIAWNKLALEIGQTSPTKEQVMKGVEMRDWQECIKQVYGWEYDDKEIYDIVVKYDAIIQNDLKQLYSSYGFDYGNKFSNKFHPNLILQRGVAEFLDKLDSVEMPYAIISHLGRSHLDAILDVIGLADYFPPEMRVSLDSRYTDERSELLGGALRVERHPENCIVFENTPYSAETAHELLMKCISFVDPYPRYELTAADWSTGELADMELSSIRTLFSKREDDTPLALAEADDIVRNRQISIKTSYDMGE